MTEVEQVAQHLDALKLCAPSEINAYFPAALKPFRIVAGPERRACADAFRAWAEANTANAPVKRAYAILLQAVDRFISEEHEASLQLLIEARPIFTELGDSEGVGLCAMLIGAVYRTLGHFDLALKTLWEGYGLLKASGHYPVFVAAAANSMANIDIELGHLDEALAMFTITYEESARADDFYFMVYALHGLGRVYARQNKHADAAKVLHRALHLAEAHQHPLQISNSLTELATLEYHSGSLADAEALSTRALAIREQHHLLGGAVTNCIRLAEIHCQRSEWPEALAMLQRALPIAEEVRVKPKIAEVHRMLSHVHEHMRDYERSLLHHRRFHELREQVEREDSARKLADAKLIFEAEQTRKENVVIKEQKAEIQRKNHELQDTIDELTRAKIGRKAKALTLAVAVVLFIFQDAILRTVLTLLPNNYFLLLGVKMAIIFSLSPINRGIENHLLKKMSRKQRALSDPSIQLASGTS
jgi:tetratricopeptide (TPR) repeat protein